MICTLYVKNGAPGLHLMVTLTPDDMTVLARGGRSRVDCTMMADLGLPGLTSLVVALGCGDDVENIAAIERANGEPVRVVESR